MVFFGLFGRGSRNAAGGAALPRYVRDKRVIHERLPMREFEQLEGDQFDHALKFWFENKQPDGPPDWSCFRPERHPALLPNIILYEKINGRYITRIVGDALIAYLPDKLMGRYLDEVAPADRVGDVLMRLDRALTDGLPNYVEKVRLWQDNSHSFGYNVLTMPFDSQDKGRTRVLCVLQIRSSSLNP